STEFYPSVLVAKQLQGINFAFGATIVMRKQVLEKIGGFGAIADYLADDYLLGNLPANLGYDVILSDYIVDHVLGKGNIKDSIQRLIRWDKCAKVSKFWGYLGLIFTYGTVHSLLFLILSKFSLLGWSILIITWSIRLILAWFVGIKNIKEAIAKKWFWFIPIRDLITVGFWCYSFMSNKVIWRGQKMRLISGGKLELQ
ncbi:MAG TPA: glycosyltransferase, partial [Allocoleopsis sp.]